MATPPVRPLSGVLLAILLLGLSTCGGGDGTVWPDWRGEAPPWPPPGYDPDDPANPPPPGGDDPPAEPSPSLEGGVLLTIAVQGESFRWWVTNPTTVAKLEAVWNGTLPIASFGGKLRSGAGRANHNAPWSWHVDPQQNGFDIISLPESPHLPSVCENHLGYWLSTNVAFVPASPTIVAFQDYR